MNPINDLEERLDNLLKILKNLKEEKDINKLNINKIFKVVPNTVNEIDDLGLSSISFIDKVLDVVSDKNIVSMARICLTNVLQTLHMKDEQILRILSIINDELYCEGVRGGLINTLNKVIESGHKTAIDTLYLLYNNKRTTLHKKVSIAKLLINVKVLKHDIQNDLIAVIENHNLPLMLDNVGTLDSRLQAIELIKNESKFHKRIVDALLYILEFIDFSDDSGTEYEFDSVVETFLGLELSHEDIDRSIKIIGKSKLDRYSKKWLIRILKKIKIHPNKNNFFIEALKSKDKDISREEASNILINLYLSLDDTGKLLDYLELNERDLSMHLTITNILRNMPKTNPIDLVRLNKIYQVTGLNKEVYRNIKEVIKERRKMEIIK